MRFGEDEFKIAALRSGRVATRNQKFHKFDIDLIQKPLAADLEQAAETGAAEAKKVAGSVQEAAESGAEQAKQVAGASLDVAARELQAGYAKLRKMLD